MKFSLSLCFILILTGCGQSGKLYLPETKQSRAVYLVDTLPKLYTSKQTTQSSHGSTTKNNNN